MIIRDGRALTDFGFVQRDNAYIYNTDLKDGTFAATITVTFLTGPGADDIAPGEEIRSGAGSVDYENNAYQIGNATIEVRVLDAETCEEYDAAFNDSYQGKFVGAVRAELQDRLERIASACCLRQPAGPLTEIDKRRLRGEPVAWIIPANPAHYDIAQGFSDSPDGTLTWTQRIKACPGDILFIYHTEPIACITYRCEVTETDIPADLDTGDGFTRGNRLMKIRSVEQYPIGQYPRQFLNEHGIKVTVRGQRSCPDELLAAITGRQRQFQYHK